jgi:predicted aspartyl protease
MISGTVNARLEMMIRVPVRDAAGHEQEVEAQLDTAFTGSLTLPNALITSLGLPWQSRGSAVLANGGVEQFDFYAATVLWDGAPRQILVHAIDIPPLLGMTLLDGYDLRARVRPGGAVEIEAVP